MWMKRTIAKSSQVTAGVVQIIGRRCETKDDEEVREWIANCDRWCFVDFYKLRAVLHKRTIEMVSYLCNLMFNVVVHVS